MRRRGGTILLAAHPGLIDQRSIVVAAHLKDELMRNMPSLIYNGFWFRPSAGAAGGDRQEPGIRPGRVTAQTFRASVFCDGRRAKYSLYDQELVTFEEGRGRLRPSARKASSSSTRCGCHARQAQAKLKL